MFVLVNGLFVLTISQTQAQYIMLDKMEGSMHLSCLKQSSLVNHKQKGN